MSVTIESLHFYNGFSYRECFVPLARQGLVYLNGRNGHGKSTPFEVLQHVLFGTTSRGARKDGIGCAVPGTDGFLAELTLRNPAGRWLIRQSRGHSRYRTAVTVMKEVDGEWRTSWHGGGSPKRMDDAQKLAGSLIGLQAHEFAGCMYLSQASAHTLIEGTPAERMRYIAQLFGLDVCDRMVDLLRRWLKDVEAEAADAPALEAESARLSEDVSTYDVPTTQDRQVLRDATAVAAVQKERLRNIIYDARDALASAGQRAGLLRELERFGDVGDYDGLVEAHGRMDRKRDALRDLLRDTEERARLRRQLDDIDVPAEPKEIDGRLAKAEAALASAARTVEQLEERARIEASLARLPATGDCTALQASNAEQMERRGAATLALRQNENEIERLGRSIASCSDGTCPTCRQPLDVSAMRQLLCRAEAEQPTLRADVDEATRTIADLRRRLLAAQQRAEYERALAGLPSGTIERAFDERRNAEATVTRLRHARLRAERAAVLARRLDKLPDTPTHEVAARLQRVERSLDDISGRLDQAARASAIERQLAQTREIDVDATERTVRLAEEAAAAIDEAEAVVRERFVRAELAVQDYERLEAELQDVDERLAGLAGPRRRVHVLRYAVAATQKLKRRQLHRVVESIRDCLPRFASTMFSHEPATRFVVGVDDESIDLSCRRIVDGQAIDIPVKSFSGGEKQRLSVALVFTLHALLHAAKRPDLLILDEVDRGLDDVGIASLMSLVRGVREQYGTVVMTSHRSQIAGAAFDRTWSVTKAREESRLTTDGGARC